MEIGWSLRRSGSAAPSPRLVIRPTGILLLPPAKVQPALGALASKPPEPGWFRRASKAMVPSWHERHAKDVPLGCPTAESSVGLVYTWNVAVVFARFHNGAATVVSAPCGVWQKTQTSEVPSVWMLPAFVLATLLRLCLVSRILAA